MVRKKTKSHRQTLGKKYMIDKKAKAHRKKTKKLARLHPWAVNKSRKDPGIPNLCPFKEQVLKSATKKRNDAVETKEVIERLRHTAIRKRQELLDNAMMRQTKYQSDMKISEQPDKSQVCKTRRWYFRELRSVVESSDVILIVLDARDPSGCRCTELETRIVGEMSARAPRSKRIVFILNKIDLVPREIAEEWLAHLRQSFPTVAFKASTQNQKANLNFSKGKAESACDESVAKSGSLGADALLQLLKNYSRNLDMKTSLTVGVIGFPNVGKSSIINSLKRCRAVATGATPGLTKTLQEVHLDGKIKLIDSPGVLFSDDDNDNNNAILRNAIRVESISDPSSAVETLINRFPKQELMQIYEIASFNNASQFLLRVAHKRGKLKRGGVADVDAAALCVLHDWNNGRIPFFTRAPATEKVNAIVDTQIVTAFDEQFDLDAALDAASTAMDEDTVFVPVESTESTLAMEFDDCASVTPCEREETQDPMQQDSDQPMSHEENTEKQFKSQTMKSTQKSVRLQGNKPRKSSDLVTGVTDDSDDNEDYDFKEHF